MEIVLLTIIAMTLVFSCVQLYLIRRDQMKAIDDKIPVMRLMESLVEMAKLRLEKLTKDVQDIERKQSD